MKGYLCRYGLMTIILFLVFIRVQAQDEFCELLVIEGNVEVQRSDEIFLTSKDIKLYMGDIVRTKQGAIAMVLQAGIAQTLLPEEQLVMTACVGKTSDIAGARFIPTMHKLLKNVFRPVIRDTNRIGAMKGDKEIDDSIYVVSPAHGTILLSCLPTFYWSQDVSMYLLELYQGEKLIWSINADRRQCIDYPKNIEPLLPGREYHWEIVDLNDPRLNDGASFSVAINEQRDNMSRKISDLQLMLTAAQVNDVSSSLAIAGLLMSEGFNHDALEMLVLGIKTHPQSSEIEIALKQIFHPYQYRR